MTPASGPGRIDSVAFAEFVAAEYRSTVELTWDYPHVGYAVARFTPAGADKLLLNVTVEFELREAEGPWYASFNVQGIDVSAGVRAAFDIFNGVIQAIEEFLSVRQPGTMVIVSNDEQLGRIYQTYLRREAAAIEKLGYRVEPAEHIEPYTEFTLKRVKPSEWRE